MLSALGTLLEHGGSKKIVLVRLGRKGLQFGDGSTFELPHSLLRYAQLVCEVLKSADLAMSTQCVATADDESLAAIEFLQ